jgi:SAM-dependent methyltransferase
MGFNNVYEDEERAEAYAKLEFPGTYHLAFRDLPGIFSVHVKGKRAMDFGCGTGRSTRFLKGQGFDTVGVDISGDMIGKARELDPEGEYLVVGDGDLSALGQASFDLILCAFPFDNIAGVDHRAELLRGLGDLLSDEGRIVVLGSTPEMYTNEWLSFSTKDFPENFIAGSGDKVAIIQLDTEDKRPVVDILWFPEDYDLLFKDAGLNLIASYHPLANHDEPWVWVNETRIAPWVIYVLGT